MVIINGLQSIQSADKPIHSADRPRTVVEPRRISVLRLIPAVRDWLAGGGANKRPARPTRMSGLEPALAARGSNILRSLQKADPAYAAGTQKRGVILVRLKKY